MIWIFDSVANWIFPKKSPSLKTKCQINTFHEVLPGNLVFFHFYYIGTKEIQCMDHTIEFSMKNYIIEWNCTSGIQFLSKRVRKQAVYLGHGTLVAWELRNLGTCESGNLGTWEHGNLGTWVLKNLGTRDFENLGSWAFGNLSNLGTYAFRKFGFWVHTPFKDHFFIICNIGVAMATLLPCYPTTLLTLSLIFLTTKSRYVCT